MLSRKKDPARTAFKMRNIEFCALFLAAVFAVPKVGADTTIIETAVIYDDYYKESLTSFWKAINESTLQIQVTEFFQDDMTNIVETVTAAKVSSLFILAKHIDCAAMIELKQAVTVFFIGMVRELEGVVNISGLYFDKHCEPGDDFFMYMYPSHFDVMMAMYHAIEKYDWKTAAVFYDGSDGLAFDYQDLDLARQRGINFKVWVIPEDQNKMWDILKSVRLLGYRTYVLICDHKITTSVLTKAVFLSMVSEVNHWFLPNTETHPVLLQDFLESSVRLTVVSATTIRDVLEQNYVLGVDERHARDDVITAVTADALRRIGQSCQTAISIGCFDIPLSDDSLCGIDQGAKSFSSGSYYSVGTCTELYMRGLKQMGPTKIEYLEHHLGNEKGKMSLQGYWKDDSFVSGYIPFVQAAVVFPEKPLRVGIVYELPWVKWHINEVTSETTYEGFLIDLVETLSRRLNFKYELYWNERTGRDRLSDAEAEEEVNRMLRDREVEFVLHTRSILGNNLGSEELSIAFQQVSYFMVTLASGNDQPVNIWQFLAPFTFDSWVALCSSLVAVSIMLALVNHFNPFEWRKMALDDTNDDVDVAEFNRLGFGNSVWMAYGGLVHQGVDIEARSYAGRMITGTWWYFTMLVIAAYTANLTAFLTQEFSEEVASLEELLQQSHFDYGTMADAHIIKYFLPYADFPPFSTVWERFQEKPQNVFNTTDEVLSRISEGSFYFLAPFREVVKAEQMNCLYSRVGEGFWEYQYALPFQLNSRYTAVFSDALASLRDDGTLQELESKWFNFRTECKEASFDMESNRLGIGNLGGMFITLLIGSILAFVVHGCEIAWSKRRKLKYFRNKSIKKEIKDDPVTEMKRKREQAKKELDQQIEEWEGGFDYWMKRMDRINKTLEHIDEETNLHKNHLGYPSGNRSSDVNREDISWWKNAYQKVTSSASTTPPEETDLEEEKAEGGGSTVDSDIAVNDSVDVQDEVVKEVASLEGSAEIDNGESQLTLSDAPDLIMGNALVPPEFGDEPEEGNSQNVEDRSDGAHSAATGHSVLSGDESQGNATAAPEGEEAKSSPGLNVPARIGRMISFNKDRKRLF